MGFVGSLVSVLKTQPWKMSYSSVGIAEIVNDFHYEIPLKGECDYERRLRVRPPQQFIRYRVADSRTIQSMFA